MKGNQNYCGSYNGQKFTWMYYDKCLKKAS